MINDETYEVTEISIGAMLPILPRLQGDGAQDAQIDMMKACVMKNGALLGEAILEVGVSTYLKLAEEVMAINGLGSVKTGADGEEAGKS